MSEIPLAPPAEMVPLLHSLGLELAISPENQTGHLTALRGGRNNRLWQLQTQMGPVILKAYCPDARPRLQTEWHFLSHAEKLGLKSVPKPLGYNQNAHLALLSWLPGQAITPEMLQSVHIQQYLKFLMDLNPPGQDLQAFAPASDSCFSLEAHLQSLAKRVSAFKTESFFEPEVAELFAHELLPLWQKIEKDAQDWPHPTHLFEKASIWLSPSDVGFHNALLSSEGQLAFVDFEYAGIDHRLKTLADFLTSVGVPLPVAALSEIEALLQELGAHPEERRLFRQLLPLHQLKWCCILMGLFSPSAVRRRDFAGGLSAASQKRQIARIRAALARTRQWQHLAFEPV
ncbi:MAG: aminoglycoside phosphotransferase family protein [Candidatus Sericytochromatia bacterium]